MNKLIYFEIGRTSLGNPVRIPWVEDRGKLECFVEGLSLTEQTDVFCMTEYLNHKSQSRVNEGPEATLTEEVFDIGYQKFKQGLFDELLTEKKLPTSAARIIYGRSLCHIAYHE